MNSPTRFWAILASSVTVGAAVIVGSITYAQRDAIRISPRDIPAALQGAPHSATLIAANLPQGNGAAGGAPGTAQTTPSDPSDNNKIALVVELLMTKYSYLRLPADQLISNRLFDRFLDGLDPAHLYFLQSDIAEWAPRRDTLAQTMAQTGDTDFAQSAFKRYKEHLGQEVDFAEDALKTKTFSFDGDDTVQLMESRKDAPRPKDLDEAKKLWLQELRLEYLQLLLNNKKPAEIVTTLTKRYERMKKEIDLEDPDEVFEGYLSTFCLAFDPHSDYFGKAKSDEFSILMSASLTGIGAQLKSNDGYVEVEQLIPGGPAFRSKMLKVGDKIVGVQKDPKSDVVDVVDTMSLTKVVQMIRGEKGTTVRLVLQPAGADPSVRKTIELKRDEVKLEDNIAKSRLIELPSSITGGKPLRIGVLSLPSFYGEPGAPHHTTSDLRALIGKLKEENVSGIVLDLRGNGGGSLEEATGTVGLFVPHGPVVQQRDSQNKVEIKDVPDAGPVWTGPLIVMTNRGSASASEIVTGALRDYGRALIVGDTHTFGKSTVQEPLALAEIMPQANLKTTGNPGSIHLTIAKYYLPSGASVQKVGVQSDIVVPALTNVEEIGEQYYKNPLEPDSIQAATYDKLNEVEPFVKTLKERSEQRVTANPDFAVVKDEIARYEKNHEKKTYSLNEAEDKKERADVDAWIDAHQKVLAARKAAPETVWAITVADSAKPGLPAPLKAGKTTDAASPSLDESDPDSDTTGGAKKTALPEPDYSLTETEHIMLDYINMQKGSSALAKKR